MDKNIKATINPNNNNDKCFQYPIVAVLNHEQILKNPQKIKIEPFLNQYDWNEINFPSFRQIANQLLLKFCLYHVLKKKQNKHIFQSTTDSAQAK